MTGPYAEHAWPYWGAGWRGVLPLPAGAKWPPPKGFTGWAGVMPSGADVQAWIDGAEGAGNLALRLPLGVYGLDVDDYSGKTGGAALAELVDEHGPLPATWIVSSRDDSTSGIRIFRATVAMGRRWRDEPAGHGRGIEAIHFGHRYAVAWPSIHPQTGRKYVWRRPDGVLAADGELPHPDTLAELPDAWIEALSEPGEVRSGEMAGHTETLAVVHAWRDGEPCPRVGAAAARGDARLREAVDGAALHPAGRDTTQELVALGHEGHAGARLALAQHYGAFTEARAGRGEAPDKAAGEWWRLVRGAVGKLIGLPADMCDCGLRAGEGLTFTPDDFGIERPALVDEDATTSGGGTWDGEAPAASRRVDLRPWLTGTYVAPEPSRGAERDDTHRLLYPGRWHSVVGSTGAGKSWLALVHARDEIAAWRPVVYLHFEEHSPAGTVARLMALGVPPEHIAERFVWLDCDRMWERGELAGEIAGVSPGLVVLDGINAACTRHGFDPSSVEAVGWYRDRFVSPAAVTGAAVLSLGHPPKARDRQDERHGFGSTAWLDECDGVGFRLTASKTPIRRGAHGHAALHSVKDRYGSVEAKGRADGGRDGWVYLGSLHVDDAGEATTARLTMPSLLDPAGGAPGDPIDALAAAVAGVMGTHGSAFQSERQLLGWLRGAGVRFNDHDVDPALDRLEMAARITRDPYAARRPRGARLCRIDLDEGDLNDG